MSSPPYVFPSQSLDEMSSSFGFSTEQAMYVERRRSSDGDT